MEVRPTGQGERASAGVRAHAQAFQGGTRIMRCMAISRGEPTVPHGMGRMAVGQQKSLEKSADG